MYIYSDERGFRASFFFTLFRVCILGYVIFQYINSFFVVASNFVFASAIINTFTKSDYGSYTYILSFLVPVSLLSNLGISGYLQKKIPDISSGFKNSVVTNLLLIKFVLSITVSYAIIFFLNIDLINSILLGGYFTLFVCNQLYYDTYFPVIQKQKTVFLVRGFQALVKISSIFIFYDALTIEYLLFILFISELLAYIYTLKYLDFTKMVLNFKDIASEKRIIFNFSAVSILELLLSKSVAVWYINHIQGKLEVASYSFVVNMTLLCLGAFSVLSRFEVLLVSARNDVNKFKLLSDICIVLFTLQLTLVAFIFIPYSDFILSMVFDADKYGPEFSVLSFFVFFVLLSHIVYIATAYVYKEQCFNVLVRSSIVSGLTHVVLLYPAISLLGYKGALLIYVVCMFLKPIVIYSKIKIDIIRLFYRMDCLLIVLTGCLSFLAITAIGFNDIYSVMSLLLINFIGVILIKKDLFVKLVVSQ